MRNKCTEHGCDKYRVGGGLCRMHYMRRYRNGDTSLRRGENGVPWKRHDGYIVISVCGKATLQHRFVMEKSIGRSLLPEEIVHHINGDRSDNRIENLVITCTSEHMRNHNIGNKHALGLKHTEETKKVLSEISKSHWRKNDFREKISRYWSESAEKRKRDMYGKFV